MNSVVMVHVFILLVSLSIVSGTVSEKCDTTRIMQCMEKVPLQEIAEMLKSQDMEVLKTELTLDKFCGFQKELSNCVKDNKIKCKSPRTLTIDTTVSAGGFLCSEGKQDLALNGVKELVSLYRPDKTVIVAMMVKLGKITVLHLGEKRFIENFQCIMTKFVVNQTAILSCFKFIPQLIEKRDSKTGSDASDEICRISEKVTSCMDIKAKELCGEKSVPFVHSYLQATMKPLMRGVTCNNGQTTIKQQWTSVMIFVTLIICLYNILHA